MFTVSTEIRLSGPVCTDPAGKVYVLAPSEVELPRKTPFSQTDEAAAPPPLCVDSVIPVSVPVPVPVKRPRYQVLPVWKP
jgi:hypothetical protein